METLSESRLRNLGEFFFVLHARGWTVTDEHHARVTQLLERLGSDLTSAKLKRLLCPIFATDAVEQEAFRTAYDDYFLPVPMIPAERNATAEPVAETPSVVVARRERPMVLAIAAVVAVALVVAAVWRSSVDRGARDTSTPPSSKPALAESSTTPQIAALESDAAPSVEEAALQAVADAAAAAAISSDESGSFQECMVQGRAARERQLHATAITAFRAAATLSPDNPAPLAEIAAIYEEMKLRESAKQEWQQIYDLGPEKAGVYHELAGVMLNKFGSLALGAKDRKPHSRVPEQPAADGSPHDQSTLSTPSPVH